MDKLEFVIPQETAVAVEYPGFVRDTSRAVQTLGGMDAIAAAVTIHGHHLRLRHRPEDRTSHPLYAERVEPTRLVLRISRASAPAPAPAPEADGDTAAEGPSSSAPEPMATSEASETPPVSVSMVARVTQTFRFPGLADFAFLPNDPLLGVRSREKIPYEQRAERTEPAHAVQPFLLIPQLFSWLDMPQDYAFRQPQGKAQARAAHTDRSEPHWGDAPVISFYAEGVPPPVSNPAAALTAAQAAAEVKAKALATKAAESKAVAAGAAAVSSVAANTPAAAEAANTAAQAAAAAEADAEAAAAALAELQDTGFVKAVGQEVEALLAQRPVWGLELLRERVAASPAVVAAAAAPDRVDAARVEQAVRRLCYRFKTGPWRGLFIRRGFDPRIQVEARQHQALVYTLPHNWYRNLLRAAVRATRQQLQGQGAGAAGSARAPGEGKPQGQAEGEGAEGSQQAPAGAEGGAEGAGAAAGGGGAAPPPAMGALATSALAPVSMDDLHNFRALPTQASSTFQLCDLRLPEVQAVLQGPLPEDGARCSEKTGWFSNSEQQSMQAAVQKRFALLMDQMAPPGAAASAKKGAAAAAKAAGGSGAAADGAAGADVEMADAAAAGEGPSAEGQQAAEGGAADAAAANRAEAIRALMAEMKLGGMGAEEDAAGEADGDGEAEGEGDDGAAARAAARSAAAAAEIANLFGDEDEEEADFPLLDDTGAETAGEEADVGADVSPTAGVRRRRSSVASADGTPGEEGYVGYDSAYETEYADDMEGDDDDEDEDEEEDEDEDGQGSGRRAGGAGVVSGAESDGYGRVTVPYDGATVGRGVSMFGSDDDDYGDAYD